MAKKDIYMVYDALETVKLRNNFYRDSYHKIVIALFVELFLIGVLSIAVMFLVSQKPTPIYFAATDSGRIIPLIPLDRPNLSDKALLQWTSEAVVSLYSYNFVNFREIFQGNRSYFTAAGWRGFMQALDASKNLETVRTKKLIVSAVLTGAPVITNQYVLNGRYTWQIQMPLLVTYQGSTDRITQNFILMLKIERVSTLDNVYGVGISEFVAQQS
jgi:intracellular multiplication protein IcmL